MKRIFLATAVFLATSGLAAAYTSPYIGASTGVVNNSVNTKGGGVNGTFGSYRGVPLNLFAGYGGLMTQSFYLAGELVATAGAANISNNDDLKSSFGVGASILPGVMLNDLTLAFVRAGFVYSRFPNAANNATWRTGGQFGFGLLTSLTQNLDIRGEYDFVAYESENETESGITYSVAPRSDQFSVGLIYKFE